MRKIIDNFISDFDVFRMHCDGLDYAGVVNPADGVMYPGISLDIPSEMRAKIINKMQKTIGRALADITMFLRLTVAGQEAPHQAHNDAIMGDYGLVLYLNREEHCKGGTSFVRHIETGIDGALRDAGDEGVWRRDTNVPDAWEITEMAEMAPNRALVFETQDMHRAEPPEAFGDAPDDGRLVLVCFARAA